jgi:hypothetical protein
MSDSTRKTPLFWGNQEQKWSVKDYQYALHYRVDINGVAVERLYLLGLILEQL